jgi:23S rRNA G2445 N2-methylase RlmL
MLAACTTTAAPPAAQDTCDAIKVAGFVGQVADKAMLDQVRRAAGATTVRVVPPDTIVTTEYRFGRLTVDIDATGKMSRIACG